MSKVNRTKGLILVCLAALVAAVNAGCPPKPNNDPQNQPSNPPGNQSTARTEIVIEDGHVTAWMPINNSFSNNTNQWDTNDIHWKGILIQLGRWIDGPQSWKVTLEDSAGQMRRELTVADADFQRWIDVMAVDDTGQPAHMRKPSEPGNVAVAMTNDMACWLAPALSGCAPPSPAGCPAVGCSDCRNRSLHRAFGPQRVLTCWPGASGYQVTAKMKTGEQKHMTYTFALQDKVKIRIDEVEYLTPGAIRRIVITSTGGSAGHKDTEDPPWPVP